MIASIWGTSVEEYSLVAAPLKRVADRLCAVEVNLSCPNVEQRRHVFAHSAAATAAAVGAVVDALGGGTFVLAKLSPNVTDIVEIAGAALEGGANGLTLVNTVMGLLVDARERRPRLGAGGGGLSGAPIKPIALRCVWEVAQAFPGTPIIGTGGVASGEDAVEMMLAGATAVGVGTATFANPTRDLADRPGGARVVRGAWDHASSGADRGDARVNPTAPTSNLDTFASHTRPVPTS